MCRLALNMRYGPTATLIRLLCALSRLYSRPDTRMSLERFRAAQEVLVAQCDAMLLEVVSAGI